MIVNDQFDFWKKLDNYMIIIWFIIATIQYIFLNIIFRIVCSKIWQFMYVIIVILFWFLKDFGMMCCLSLGAIFIREEFMDEEMMDAKLGYSKLHLKYCIFIKIIPINLDYEVLYLQILIMKCVQ